MSERRLVVNRTEIILLITTIAVSSLVSLLDFFGFLDSIPWLKGRVPALTLLVLGLLASYILIERKSKLESISDQLQDLSLANTASTRKIIESLAGVEVTTFNNLLSCLQYVNQQLRAAKIQIDDLSWTPTVGKSDDLEAIVSENAKYRERVIQAAKRLPYREVFIFNRKDRIEKLINLLSENAAGYSCAYFEETKDLPLLQFMIVDRQEVIVLSGDYTYLAFRHPQLVNLFVEYYEDIWKKSIKLKHGKRFDWGELQKVVGEDQTKWFRANLARV
jgi:hypothetical protein